MTKLPYRKTLDHIAAVRRTWERDRQDSELCALVVRAILQIEKVIREYHAELVSRNPDVPRRDGAAYKNAAEAALRLLVAGERSKAMDALRRVVKD